MCVCVHVHVQVADIRDHCLLSALFLDIKALCLLSEHIAANSKPILTAKCGETCAHRYTARQYNRVCLLWCFLSEASSFPFAGDEAELTGGMRRRSNDSWKWDHSLSYNHNLDECITTQCIATHSLRLWLQERKGTPFHLLSIPFIRWWMI